MKNGILCILPLAFLFSGCATPSGISAKPPIDETTCRASVRKALVFASTPRVTLEFFQKMATSGGADGKHMDAYYSTLGINLSSVAFVLNTELDERISIDLADADTAEVSRWLGDRLPRGKSTVDLEDVDGTFFDGEFLRVDLKADSLVSGYFYIHCGVIEGRNIEEKVFVDYFQAGATEPRKLSLAALLQLM